MTYSIVARSVDGSSWGVAVASRFVAIGASASAAVAGVGAVVTQARMNVAWKGLALAHLDEGATADVAVEQLVEEDPDRAERQVAIVDAVGRAVVYTGQDCTGWAGGYDGDGFAVVGNVLTGPEVVEAIRDAYLATEADAPLADRLLAALRAGEEAGGDLRGRQAAALLVVRDGAGYGGLDDVAVDVRVDDHPDPLTELERLVRLDTEQRAEYAAHDASLTEGGQP